MAVPSYTEDLTDIDLAEVATNYLAINFSGGGGGAPAAGIDLAMQGTNCMDRPVSNHERGIVFNNGATIAGSVASGVHIFQWLFVATPGLTDLYSVRGAYVIAGTGTGALVQFTVEGNDTYGAAPRVGRCYAYRYLNTANTGSVPYRTLTGSPGATPQYFGAGMKTTATAKGSNLGVDAMRYGTGAYITAGDVSTPATFTGFAAQSDAIANRWGILTDIGGTLELQGRFVVGQNNSKTATAAYFDDTGINIVLVDTVHSETDFTQVIIDHASTAFNMTSCNITALGTNNPGRLVFNNASTTSALTSCTFSSIGITTLRAGVTATTCQWKITDAITQNGATLSSCVVEDNTAAIAITADDAALISDSTFISDGTGHAIEIAPTGAGPHTINMSGNQFSGYAATDGSTGNEAILINPATTSADITLNIVGGGSTPTIMEHASYTGTFTLVVSPVTLSVKVTTTAGVNIEDAMVLALVSDATNFPYDATVTATSSGTTATVTHTAHGLASNDYVQITGANENNYNGSFQITVTGVNTYTYTMPGTGSSPATGTLKCTTVLIKGLTDVNGEISDTRSYGVNQAITGRVRKSTSSPFYKTSGIAGTVDKDSGATLNIQLIGDE